MTDSSRGDVHKEQMAAGFNALAPTFDRMHFLKLSAQRFAELTPLYSGTRVLDIATGTGVVALDAARRVGTTGSVVGLDIAPEMLSIAQSKLAQAGLTNVEFRLGDAEHLDFAEQRFDRVLCASALFFFSDIATTLRAWKRVLASGGMVGFTGFGAEFMQPLFDLWVARLQRHGLAAVEIPFKRLGTPEICEAYLHKAGYTDITVRHERLGYYVQTVEQRWEDIMAGLEGRPLLQLSPDQREQIKAEHLAELAAHVTAHGIWINVDSLFAFGRTG